MEWALILTLRSSLEKEERSCPLDLGLKNKKDSYPLDVMTNLSQTMKQMSLLVLIISAMYEENWVEPNLNPILCSFHVLCIIGKQSPNNGPI